MQAIMAFTSAEHPEEWQTLQAACQEQSAQMEEEKEATARDAEGWSGTVVTARGAADNTSAFTLLWGPTRETMGMAAEFFEAVESVFASFSTGWDAATTRETFVADLRERMAHVDKKANRMHLFVGTSAELFKHALSHIGGWAQPITLEAQAGEEGAAPAHAAHRIRRQEASGGRAGGREEVGWMSSKKWVECYVMDWSKDAGADARQTIVDAALAEGIPEFDVNFIWWYAARYGETIFRAEQACVAINDVHVGMPVGMLCSKSGPWGEEGEAHIKGRIEQLRLPAQRKKVVRARSERHSSRRPCAPRNSPACHLRAPLDAPTRARRPHSCTATSSAGSATRPARRCQRNAQMTCSSRSRRRGLRQAAGASWARGWSTLPARPARWARTTRSGGRSRPS